MTNVEIIHGTGNIVVPADVFARILRAAYCTFDAIKAVEGAASMPTIDKMAMATIPSIQHKLGLE